MAKQKIHGDLEVNGNLSISTIPNQTGTLLTLGSVDGKTISTRTNAQIIGDLGLASINGNVATATKLQTTRTLWGVNFDGSGNVTGALTGVTNLTASGILSAKTLENTLLDLHPEGNTTILPYISNDIAYLTKRGGTVTNNIGISSGIMDMWFDGTPSYGGFNMALPAEGLIIEINFNKTFYWGTKVGINFGNSGWGSNDIKVETYDVANAKWVLNSDITNNNNNYHYVNVGLGGGISKMRWTLNNFKSADKRIAQIWVLNYNSSLMKEVFVGRDGGSLYGALTSNSNISTTGVITATGGNSTNWNTAFTNNHTHTNKVFLDSVVTNATLALNISGSAAKWGTMEYVGVETAIGTYIMGYGADNKWHPIGTGNVKAWLGITEGTKIGINPTGLELNTATYGKYGGVVQDSTSGPVNGSWYNKIKILHDNAAGYYTELAQSFTGTEGLYHRKMTAGTLSAWKTVLDDSNYGIYALSRGGGTMVGTITSTVSTGEALRINHNGAYISGFNTAGTVRQGYLQFASGDVVLASETGTKLLKLNPNGGNVSIGYSVDVGYKFAANGSGYFEGSVTSTGGFKSTNLKGMVGDYDQNGNGDKIIWTIGDQWNSIGSMYGIGYSFASKYAPGAHQIVFRDAGTVYASIGLGTGNAWFDGRITAGVGQQLNGNAYGTAQIETQGVNPGIGFHYPSAYGASLWMSSGGTLQWNGNGMYVTNSVEAPVVKATTKMTIPTSAPASKTAGDIWIV
ncbi:hypothetical protein [Pedobacter immunditicola]|uniref:hypothetical protein n=1 Tax=Pedobacter immunditicola TaxID=3133440 RepID=UPI0030ADD977